MPAAFCKDRLSIIKKSAVVAGALFKDKNAANPPRLVPLTGVEPVWYRYHWILSPARLPIPPQRRILEYYIITKIKNQAI